MFLKFHHGHVNLSSNFFQNTALGLWSGLITRSPLLSLHGAWDTASASCQLGQGHLLTRVRTGSDKGGGKSVSPTYAGVLLYNEELAGLCSWEVTFKSLEFPE